MQHIRELALLSVLFWFIGFGGQTALVDMAAGAQEAAEPSGDETEQQSQEDAASLQFDTYYMVFLRSGENPPQIEPEALQDLQRKHLAHLRSVAESGHSLVAGPFEVPPEHDLRGIVIYRGDLTKEAVQAMADADPMVKAGRLKAEVLRWWTPKGHISFERGG